MFYIRNIITIYIKYTFMQNLDLFLKRFFGASSTFNKWYLQISFILLKSILFINNRFLKSLKRKLAKIIFIT